MLRLLGAGRYRLTDGLLDDARAGKADERLGLGDVQVTEHREARSDAAGCGVGKYREVGNRRLVETGKGRAYLSHLHQRKSALLHPRSS